MTARPALLAWAAAGAVALAYPFAVDPYWLTVGILALFYAIVTASWTLLVGYAGQFSFGHMGFVALGAYASALLVRHAGLPIPLAALAAIALCLAVGACIGGICLRMRGPYLAIFTLAFAEVLRIGRAAAIAAAERLAAPTVNFTSHSDAWSSGQAVVRSAASSELRTA